MPLAITIPLCYFAIGWVLTTVYYFFTPWEEATVENAIQGVMGWPLFILIMIVGLIVCGTCSTVKWGREQSQVFAFFFFNCLDPRFWATKMRNIINRSTK